MSENARSAIRVICLIIFVLWILNALIDGVIGMGRYG